jgi:hypothetical protein
MQILKPPRALLRQVTVVGAERSCPDAKPKHSIQRMRLLLCRNSTVLAGEADDDLGAGGHHASGRGNLLARDSAAYDLQCQTSRTG